MDKKAFKNRKLWRTLEIGSHRVPVYLGETMEAYKAYGLAILSPEYFIVLDKSLSLTQRRRTLLHEVMEVVNDVFDLGLTETGIRCMEQGVFQALLKNGSKTKSS